MANVILLLVEQELPNLPEHLISSPVFSGVRVTRSLVLCVCFVDRCLAFYTFILAIVLSVLLRYTDSDYPFGILWPLCFQFFFDIRILIIPLVSCGHCVVNSSSIYRFWLPLWYLVAIVLSVLLRYTDSDYPFGILWPLCCLFFFDIRI